MSLVGPVGLEPGDVGRDTSIGLLNRTAMCRTVLDIRHGRLLYYNNQ
jgi:hypothetical protein